MTTTTLSVLHEQEAIIERGLASFVEVGNALMRIRDDGLYREEGFDGFVEYLESKPWGIDARRAYKQIEASVVAGHLPHVANERQAVELAPLLRKATPKVVQQVYAEAVQETDGKPTARVLRDKVREVLTPSSRKTIAPDGALIIRQATFQTGVAYAARTSFKKIEKEAIGELISEAENAVMQWNEIIEALKGSQQ